MRASRALIAFAIATALPRVALAQERPETPDRLLLFVAPGPLEQDAPRLRTAVATELGTDVVLVHAPPAHDALVLRPSGDGDVSLVYRAAGREVERAFDVPDRSEARAEVVALMAGNLVRDEAGDLIASLRAGRRAAAAPDPPAWAPAAPPPVAAPVRAAPIVATSPTEPERPACSEPGVRPVPIGADFAPWAGTSAFQGLGAVRHASVNVLGGISGGLRGAEAGGIFNVETRYACGAQAAGIANVVLGPVRGAQVSGVANVSGGLEGAQAGVINVDSRGVLGAQVGVANVTRGPVTGSQLGVGNVASGEVRGVQLGVFNYADQSDVSIGVVSIVRHGTTEITAWGADWGFVGAGVKHGGRHFYNVYGAGVRPGGDGARGVLVLGIGAHFDLGKLVFVDADVVGHAVLDGTGLTVASIRAPIGLRVTERLAIYAAPTYSVSLGGSASDDVAPSWKRRLDAVDGYGWPGAAIGAQGRL